MSSSSLTFPIDHQKTVYVPTTSNNFSRSFRVHYLSEGRNLGGGVNMHFSLEGVFAIILGMKVGTFRGVEFLYLFLSEGRDPFG